MTNFWSASLSKEIASMRITFRSLSSYSSTPLSGYPVPKSLAELKDKAVRFTGSIAKEEQKDFVLSALSL